MKNYYLLFALIFCINQSNFSQNSLRVGDPQTWSTYKGTIEKAVVSVKPKGIYNEYGLYLTFSSRGTSLTSVNDTLEVVLKFQLPEKAIVHDSWLFMKDWISKGKIHDKWSASQIYEDIVDRRKDPSILSKKSAIDYELRVFPMAGNETRKVKISYLLPADWTAKNISSPFPINLLKTSKYDITKLNVLTWQTEEFKNPTFSNNDIKFTSKNDATFGDYYSADVPFDLLDSSLNINFEYSKVNEIYLSKFKNDEDSEFYQLSISTELFLDNRQSKKILVLIDYDEDNTSFTTNEILEKVKKDLLNNFNSTDSFNLMTSNLSIGKFSDKWEIANNENIELSFNKLSESLSSYSNFSSLLVAGVDFINNNGTEGEILLISNSDQYSDKGNANNFINDLVALMDNETKIHIVDYQNKNISTNYINGRYYIGNEYLYSNLSKITLGSRNSIYESTTWSYQYSKPLSNAISDSFKYIEGTINSLDIYTTLKNGFCYNRFDLSGTENINFVSESLQQVGKFSGEFPFTIDITGEYQGKVFYKKIDVDEANIIQGDSITEKIWAGQYLRNLENVEQSNSIIDDIIISSKKYSLLSEYTSFLCLEEKDDYACLDCLDESVLNIIPQNFQDDIFKFYPNPFTDILNIEFTLESGEKIKHIKIIDLNGKTIYKFDTSQITVGKNKLIYRPNSNIKNGVYLINYVTNKSNYNIKLVKQ